MKRTVVALFLLLLAAPLLASACGGDEDLPEGLPEDFPLWDKATIVAATEVPDAGEEQEYLLGMESTESSAEARSFYESALGEEPWRVDNVVEIPASEVAPESPEASPEASASVETTVIVFSRSDGSQTGTLAIQEQQTNGRKTTIAVSLTVPR